jgi:hypothetical protein
MKMLKLTGLRVMPVYASVYIGKRTQVRYFNIMHGSRDFSVWSCGMNKRLFNPDNYGRDVDKIELTDNNYTLVPVETAKNPNNTQFYAVYSDGVESHTTDIILFWEIPNKRYTEVTYSISGSCRELGSGVTGMTRDGIEYRSPAPVLEIYGDVTLSWSGKDMIGQSLSQTISYDYATASWKIPPMEVTENIKGGEDVEQS